MPAASPLVAIVGQPNVGKSTLLNKIAGQPLAVTSPLAGTTRDRQYVDVAWNGVYFTLVDTAGLNLSLKNDLEQSLHKQIEIALAEADMLLLVVDGRLNSRVLEQMTLQRFRRTAKPTLLVLNKLDSPNRWEEKKVEFQSLGFKSIFPVSALNGRGIGDLLDEIASTLSSAKKGSAATAAADESIKVSLIGKPNVGKSSLFNKILDQERVVVSPLPGTTRTAIDERIVISGQPYSFIDTAGLKKKTYRQEQPDLYGGFQTFKAIRRSDVCLFLIDADEELTKQDQRIASEIYGLDRGVILLANKIDRYNGDREKLRDYISFHFPFLWMSPLFFVSAKTGEGLEEVLSAIKPIYDTRQKKVDNQTLSEFLSKALKRNPPRQLRDQKPPKVFSLHQVGVNPPQFVLTVNHPAAISQQFKKFLENSIIKELDFWGTPILLRLTGKDKT